MPSRTRRFEGELRVAPPMGDEHFKQIPAKRGVVMLAGESDRPILLLTAADIRARVRARLRNPDPQERSKLPDLHRITRKILWTLCASPFETDLEFFETGRETFADNYTELLAFKPGWFVHVDPAETWAHFARTREVFARDGRYFGPFAAGRSAQRFVEVVQDVFDLCRDIKCLRKSPHGQRCSYGQMGRCLCPCDGTVGMDEYRRAVAEAADMSACPPPACLAQVGRSIRSVGRRVGGRKAIRARLAEQMAAASEQLNFESAGRLKRKIERLEELDGPDFAHVAPAEVFQYLIVQRGPGGRGLALFLADRGWIDRPRTLKMPVDRRQLASALKRMRTWTASNRGFGVADRWRMGLVIQYLFRRARGGGLMLPWRAEMTVEELGSAIASAAERLGFRPTKSRSPRKPPPPSHPD